MSDRNPIKQPDRQPGQQPGHEKGASKPTAEPRTLPCEEWEALLVDALDGTLPATDSAAFEAHPGICPACLELLTRARQGQEWLQFLAQPPVSPDLVSKILARTSGAAAAGLPLPVDAMPLPPVVPFWLSVGRPMRRMAEPRLMLTAAMAFFSVALTLNLAGVRLSAVHAADLRPSLLRSNLTRQFINSKVGVENYCYNLRIVYEMEARVRELKRTSDAEEEPARQQQPAAKGSARKSNGKSENPHNPEPRAALWGQSIEATLEAEPFAPAAPRVNESPDPSTTPQKSCVRPPTDRAEGSLA